MLINYGWPGNVRELQNAVKHGAALAMGSEVDAVDLPDELNRPAASLSSPSTPGAPRVFKTLAEAEREYVLEVLEACEGSPSEAARVLGVARNTLWRRLKTYS